MPRPLRRLGGVGCLACHGPGALPEASARWRILRADVCATCHDAPPRYGHVAAWRETAMARADCDARAAREPACARCHTTWGFLASAGARAAEVGAVDRRPPADVGTLGIACAACHSVHDPSTAEGAPHPDPLPAAAGRGSQDLDHGSSPPSPFSSPSPRSRGEGRGEGRGLLRTAPIPPVLAGATIPASAARGRICLGCHAPDPGDGGPPAASAAALWLGRGGLDPATGGPLDGPAPHAAIAGGCVGCHGADAGGFERGAAHSFVATRAGCGRCHARGLPADDLAARGRALWAALPARVRATADGSDPPHARAARLDRGTPIGRAAWNVSLVLEDRAAATHNAPYARLLLAAAEKVLNGRAP